MSIKKLNMAALKVLHNTFASLSYNGEVKCVKKAREANTTLAAAITAVGGKVANKGDALPFKTITKQNNYVVSIGASLRYKRKVELMTARNGVETDYRPDHRDIGMFPVFGELLYVKNDFSEVYIRAYQASMPSAAKYFADGKEIPKALIGQWLPSADFQKLSGLEVSESVVADEEGNVIYCQDENGNLILDKNGEPQTMSLPPLRAIKLSNCKVFRKGEEIKFFTDEDWPLEELETIKANYYAKFAEK